MAATVEYIVADVADAAAILTEAYPHTSRAALQLDVIDPYGLTLLAAVLRASPATGAPDVEKLLTVLETLGVDGPWVLLVPEEVTSALSAISDTALQGVVVSWVGELSKWLGFEPPVQEATEWLRLLRTHAQNAREQHRPLLIYAMP
jgi:hypothetical protein